MGPSRQKAPLRMTHVLCTNQHAAPNSDLGNLLTLLCRSRVPVDCRYHDSYLARCNLTYGRKAPHEWTGTRRAIHDAVGWNRLRARRMGIVSTVQLGACSRYSATDPSNRSAGAEDLDGPIGSSNSLVRIADRSVRCDWMVSRASTERDRRFRAQAGEPSARRHGVTEETNLGFLRVSVPPWRTNAALSLALSRLRAC